MMDCQENALHQGEVEEEKNVEKPPVQVNGTESAAEEPAEVTHEEVTETEEATEPTPQPTYKTKKEVLARLKEIVANGENPNKEEVDRLKTLFYKMHNTEREARLKEYLENGGAPERYQVEPDEDERDFKAEMSVVRERRALINQQQEAEKQANLEKKLEIISKIKAMATSPDQANKSYPEFKELQQQWKEIKQVPADKAGELWRSYQLYVEQFYDLLKLNIEAREYDFKKNYELKTKLCEAAEKLAEETDVVSAFHQLQELHQQYREIGPVSKDLREDVWARFKAASTVVNKRHQQHFETLRANEEENLAKKTELCEKVESVLNEENKGAGDWEKHTKQVLALQAEWKTIGFAPQKMNVKIFDRFRTACDEFFNRKATYFKELKATFAANLEKKERLVAKARELSDSTEWRSTGDKLIALQKEWKTIGSVPKKVGDQLWNDFLTSCNKFFEARKAANFGSHGEERANLEKKRAIIERMQAFVPDEEGNVEEQVRQIVEEYNAIGHVPYKEKDKIYNEFHEALDKLYKDYNISPSRRKLESFESNLKNVAKRGEDALDNERGRLMRRYEQLRQEIQVYENNLGFLNASSKKGNSLVEEMKRKVQKLKDDMELAKQKIKAIDSEE